MARGYDDRDGICDDDEEDDDDENDEADDTIMMMGNDEVTKIYGCWLG